MLGGNTVHKVIIDCDPGIDDAVAVCMALFDPRLDVIAITAAAGNVPGEQASRNVQAIIERLDPPRFPRLGAAVPGDAGAGADNRLMHGEDGLGNVGFPVSRLHHQHPSEKVICDAVRAEPNRITLVCLGPLTNVARAFQRDPELSVLLHRLIILGGCVDGVGNVTAASEFNMFCDPNSARAVFRSPVTKTLIPLDVTRAVRLTLDFLDRLPPETTRVGLFLRRILPFMYRAHHQRLGQESIQLHAAVALAAVLDSDDVRVQRDVGGCRDARRADVGNDCIRPAAQPPLAAEYGCCRARRRREGHGMYRGDTCGGRFGHAA